MKASNMFYYPGAYGSLCHLPGTLTSDRCSWRDQKCPEPSPCAGCLPPVIINKQSLAGSYFRPVSGMFGGKLLEDSEASWMAVMVKATTPGLTRRPLIVDGGDGTEGPLLLATPCPPCCLLSLTGHQEGWLPERVCHHSPICPLWHPFLNWVTWSRYSYLMNHLEPAFCPDLSPGILLRGTFPDAPGPVGFLPACGFPWLCALSLGIAQT